MRKIIENKEYQPFEFGNKTRFAHVVTSLVNNGDGSSYVCVDAFYKGFTGSEGRLLEAYDEAQALGCVKDEKLIQLAIQNMILNIENVMSALNSMGVVEKRA